MQKIQLFDSHFQVLYTWSQWSRWCSCTVVINTACPSVPPIYGLVKNFNARIIRSFTLCSFWGVWLQLKRAHGIFWNSRGLRVSLGISFYLFHIILNFTWRMGQLCGFIKLLAIYALSYRAKLPLAWLLFYGWSSLTAEFCSILCLVPGPWNSV